MLTRNASNECQETVRWLWSGRSKFENCWTNLVADSKRRYLVQLRGCNTWKERKRTVERQNNRQTEERVSKLWIHVFEKGKCSALDKECRRCGKNGNFVSKCYKKNSPAKVKVRGRKQITFLTTNSNEFVNTLTERVNRLSDKLVTFQIDTGLICNVLPFNLYPQITKDRRGRKLKPGHTLIQHNLQEVKAKGKTFPKIERGRKMRHSCSRLSKVRYNQSYPWLGVRGRSHGKRYGLASRQSW